MIRILANDGIHADGKKILEEAGCEVVTETVKQEDLPNELPNYDVIIVRSATKVRQALIEKCPNLKIIARGGVGIDNIDADFAKSKGIEVINTPAASSQAVAELAFGHLLSLARFLNVANRDMPSQGDTNFNGLKKAYAKGIQLRGRTLGIIGFGRIGQETARIGLALGMKVLPVDPYVTAHTIDIPMFHAADGKLSVKVPTVSMDAMLAEANMISLHVPSVGRPILGEAEMAKMKKGVMLVNTARGGSIDEDALLKNLESGQVGGVGLDVFLNEPTPRKELLNHPRVSVSPHIGAATVEAQRNIGLELAEKILAYYKVPS